MRKFIFLGVAALFAAGSSQGQAGYTRNAKGVSYKMITSNPGTKIKLEDVITFQAIQKTDKDSVLFSTYTLGHPIQLQITASQNAGDLMDIFPLMAVKDSAIVRVPADSVFAGHETSRPPFLPKGSTLVFVLKIERVQSLSEALAERNTAMAAQQAETEKMKANEAPMAAKYVADHKLAVKTTASGLQYLITQVSAKPHIMKGDTVLVNYAGRGIDDKVFDTSQEDVAKQAGLAQPGRTYEPIKFVVGQSMVIPGWDEGLQLMGEGAKATFVIPSNLAYGDQGQGGVIPPYSTLVFDVEVVKVIKGKPLAHKTPVKTAAKAGAKTPVKEPAAPVKKPAAKAPVKK